MVKKMDGVTPNSGNERQVPPQRDVVTQFAANREKLQQDIANAFKPKNEVVKLNPKNIPERPMMDHIEVLNAPIRPAKFEDPEVLKLDKKYIPERPMMDHMVRLDTKMAKVQEVLNNPQAMADIEKVHKGEMSFEEFQRKYVE